MSPSPRDVSSLTGRPSNRRSGRHSSGRPRRCPTPCSSSGSCTSYRRRCPYRPWSYTTPYLHPRRARHHRALRRSRTGRCTSPSSTSRARRSSDQHRETSCRRPTSSPAAQNRRCRGCSSIRPHHHRPRLSASKRPPYSSPFPHPRAKSRFPNTHRTSRSRFRSRARQLLRITLLTLAKSSCRFSVHHCPLGQCDR